MTPYARGYFVGDYMGLASTSGPDRELLSLFGSADNPPNASSIFLRRLGP